MDGSAVVKVVIATIAVGRAGYQIWRYFFRRCPQCKNRLKLDEIRDSMGHNISKTVTVSFWKGPRRVTETWKCVSCGFVVSEKRWQWQQ